MKRERNHITALPGKSTTHASGTILLGAGITAGFGWMFPSLGTLLLIAILITLFVAAVVLIPAMIISAVDRGVDHVRHAAPAVVRLNRTRRGTRSSGGSLESV